jgi:hypothetical protein
MKRGQVTLYAIIAILLVVAVGILVYTQRQNLGLSYIPVDVRPVNDAIVNCLTSTSENGIYLIGMQGGYINLPSKVFETNLSFVGYGYYTGQKLLPPLIEIQNELDNYIELMLPKCFDTEKFNDFEFSFGEISSKSEIMEDFISINVQWPVTAKRTSQYNLNKFSAKISTRLGKIYNITDTIISKEIENPEMIDLEYLISIHDKEDISIDFFSYPDTIVYSLYDPKSIINQRPFIFLFANKFK